MSGEQRKPTIVCIDADTDNRLLITEVLQVTDDYTIVGAGDGVSGLDLIRDQRPVVALVDLDLPVISAFELMRRLRGGEAPTSRTPLIAVSSSVMKGERQRCVRAGFMAFVEKPFDIHDLRTRVAECVRKSPVK